MAYQTTIGWSILSSGVVTLLLSALPGDDVSWGVGLCVLGLAVLYVRREDVLPA